MFCLAYKPRRRVNPRVALPIATSLALLLSVAASPHAMAACTSVGVNPGTVLKCDPDVNSVLPTITFPSVSIINSTVTTSPGGGEPANQQIGVRLLASTGENTTSLTNSTSITSQVTDIVGPPNRNLYSVFGVVSTGLDDTQYAITNSGSISAVHNGVGATAGIGFISDNEELSVNNTGTISVTRGAITLATNAGNSLTAIAGANAAATLEMLRRFGSKRKRTSRLRSTMMGPSPPPES